MPETSTINVCEKRLREDIIRNISKQVRFMAELFVKPIDYDKDRSESMDLSPKKCRI